MTAALNDNGPTRSFTVLSTGTKISHYKIINKVGAGGMGEVYLAEDTELDRKVALKFLPSYLCPDEDCRKRFKREAQAAAKLSHPNIIHIYEVSEYQGRPFFAMEHVEGRTLGNVIKDDKLDLKKVIELTLQICEGLQEAHEAGVVHRDIKPANIVLDNKGYPKLLDFGLASVRGGEKVTKTGSTLGTVGYMSPEQSQGKEVDRRSDLFSLGVVLYEMITGKAPFTEEYEAATIHAIINETPEPLARYKTRVPEDLQRIVSKLLEKDPDRRYQSAADVMADLNRLKGSGGKAKERPMWKAALKMFLIGCLIGVIFFIIKQYLFPGNEDDREKPKMLAVLPFENLGDPADEYFADGITDEVIASLSKLSGLGVISRTSSNRYKKTSKSLREIGKELGVDYILEGTIKWERFDDENRVRIQPQLIKVDDDIYLWSASYDAVL
ncbi:MAG: protein kinase domain-containing protein, partial [Candidatus Zixiibacteriota bacterium]